MIQATANIRFWHCFNEPTKITLRPGQTIKWSKNWRTAEGASFEHEELSEENGTIVNKWANGGSDCDGTILNTGIMVAKPATKGYQPKDMQNQHRLDEKGNPITYPAWRDCTPQWQRDTFAEQMNY